jgi:hypothetical protein
MFDVVAILWGLVGICAAIIVVLITLVWRYITKSIDGKVDQDMCGKEHEKVNKLLHTHATTGHAGEVIP